MSNLKLLREISGVKKTTIAHLMNMSAHTYYNYEQEWNTLPKECVFMLAKMYGILPEEIENTKLSEESKMKLQEFMLLNDTQKTEKMIYNLIGERRSSIGFERIQQIKQRIIQEYNI